MLQSNSKKVMPIRATKHWEKETADSSNGVTSLWNRSEYIKLKYKVEKLALTTAFALGFKNRKNDYIKYIEKRFREVIVGVQAQLHSRKRNYGLYYWVKVGDLNMVQQIISRDDSIIHKRDAAGATAFHLAYVFQHYHIGHYLVQRFPELAALPYNGYISQEVLEEFPELKHSDFTDAMMPYTGATILHIVIIRRNFEETRWLLNYFYSNRDIVSGGLSLLLGSNVTGKFFALDGDFYIGGFPLHFAVCVNHIGIFDLVLSYASKVRITVPESHMVKKEVVHGALSAQHHDQPTASSTSISVASAPAGEVFSISTKNQSLHMDMRRGVFGSSKKQPGGEDVRGEYEEHSSGKAFNQHSNSYKSGANVNLELDNPIIRTTVAKPERDFTDMIMSPRSSKSRKSIEQNAHRTIAGQNVIFMSDLNGNGVLHLCVMYGLTDMYQHVHSAALRIMTAEVKSLYAEYASKGVGAVVRTQSIPHTSQGLLMLPKVVEIPERDKYWEWVVAESKAKVDERLVLALNKDLHSPLTLSAATIHKDDADSIKEKKLGMFQFLLHHMKQPLWTYGAVKVSRLKLEGVEIKYKLDRYQDVPRDKFQIPRHAAIDWLCINDADPKALLIPEIQSFIVTKWERCGYPSFLVRFVLHGLITIAITLIMLFINASPGATPATGQVILVDVLYLVVTLIFLWILVGEAQDFLKHKLYYLSFRGVAKYDKIVRVVKVLSFLGFAWYKFIVMMGVDSSSGGSGDGRNGGKIVLSETSDLTIKVPLTVCVISSWLHMYYFLMGFDSTGPFMLTIFRIVGRNVPYFLRFYLIIVIAFACGLSLLSNDGSIDASYGWMNILTALWTLVQNTVGVDPTHNSIDISTNVAPHLRWLADILLTFYYVSVVILMINLLIAMIGHTYEEYISYNAALLLMEKYNIMHALERDMCPVEYEHYRSLYSHRVKVTIDSLQTALSAKQPLSRAISGVFSASSKVNGDFVRHVTIESSNYDFEMQEVNTEWYSNKEVAMDVQRSKTQFKEAPHVVLFIIHPQNDFYPDGALPVPNAHYGSAQIANLIKTHGSKIGTIIVAMATHHYCNLTHACSWEDFQGEMPALYTKITYKALLEGDFQARNIRQQEWFEQYTNKLESEHHKYLTILPEYCILGTQGHAVNAVVNDALQDWAAKSPRVVQYIHHGQNKRTQMYSAVKADVEDPLDPSTYFNHDLMNTFLESDQVLVCGPSMSKCVSSTVRSLVQHWPAGSLSKLTILTDSGGSQVGCESDTEALFEFAGSKGCTLSTCGQVFSET